MQLTQNKLAIASLILGIFALVVLNGLDLLMLLVFWGFQIVTGAILLSRIKRKAVAGELSGNTGNDAIGVYLWLCR